MRVLYSQDELRQLILDKLAVTEAPSNLLMLAFWMTRHIPGPVTESMDAIEARIGEEAANAWLCGVLVESGRYVSDGATVQVVFRDDSTPVTRVVEGAKALLDWTAFHLRGGHR